MPQSELYLFFICADAAQKAGVERNERTQGTKRSLSQACYVHFILACGAPPEQARTKCPIEKPTYVT